MQKRPDNTPALMPRVLAAVALVVLGLTVAAPIVPGAGNSTGVLMLSALVAMAFASAPSRAAWLMVLLSLGIAAGAGAHEAQPAHWAYSGVCETGEHGPLPPAP